ncbi:MFS transporter [Schleiferia thermophila]|jgi:maltose/moltooligosaccharide transporter|uniref:Maltose/moltooligosaccharide transporter n=1 Tax=Schleiferia thermophila TaxID=884107 RepID=A0A369A680_9FLAO|nr:MFS transporter [Schleiferia thermophila]KFD38279.1 major facilitator transporter [Schleiferia thermophila str. Yellowstone]RCX04852.1 maltose/moltooligosaccharide transporter [Schleiferia thermophila]GCD79622.1 sugar transporter [Schleiferia thermophila]
MARKEKPLLSFWQIWNLSFGFLGVQIGYSLQNANTSRILSAVGADVHHLSLFWLAAPLAGLIVQPIVGLSSDKTWTRFGRRIPFILGGAMVSAVAMFFMPNSEFYAHLMPPVIFGAFMLLLMDTSFNVTMQPFRALVSDMVPDRQRNLGYSVQSFLINVGAVVGSVLPAILTFIGISNVPAEGEKVAATVIWSFYIGGATLFLTVIWTAINTREYPPKEYAEYNGICEDSQPKSIGRLIVSAPKVMYQLAVTQFLSWFALFLMWVYTTQALAENVWGTTDPQSREFNEAGNWTGILFAAYSVFAAVYSLLMPRLANQYGRLKVYAFSLIAGGIGLISMLLIADRYLLLIPMAGLGVAWAAILAMPYAILASKLPAQDTGVYMGLFNATITIPQIVAGLTGGLLLGLVGGHAVWMLVVAGASMTLAGLAVPFVLKE